MRINKFIAQATGLSRRSVDYAILEGRVTIKQRRAVLGDTVDVNDNVSLDGRPVKPDTQKIIIMLNKPVGYVCSRAGQGSHTIYDLLPPEYHSLKPIGRLDKDSSGLLLLTNNGDLANELAHPRHMKTKTYQVSLDKPLTKIDKGKLEQGIKVEDYTSHLLLSDTNKHEATKSPSSGLSDNPSLNWHVSMSQGRNRQIRRAFAALGYTVKTLRRIKFGPYSLANLQSGEYKEVQEL
jgi:23S rRNA pseudouridine2605 synthase